MSKHIKKSHFFVQQGGSTREMYVHGHDNLRYAHRHQRSCEAASYNVSSIISVPRDLASTKGFDDALQAIVDAATEVI